MGIKIDLKFNIKNQVNNRYKPADSSIHKAYKSLHNISRGEYRYYKFYTSADILSLIAKDSLLFEDIESADYLRYERWLKDGGRY